MKLYELLDNVTVQSNIIVSLYSGGELISSKAFKTDGLFCSDLPDGWEFYEVMYLYVDKRGRLCIELVVDD